MSDDEGAIRTLIDCWMAATARGDLDLLLSLMADDVNERRTRPWPN